MKTRLTAVIALTVALMVMTGCAAPSAKAVYKDETGIIPSGSFGIVKLFHDNQDHKHVKVSLTVSGFGDVENVSDKNDVQAVSAELVKHASLTNKAYGFNGEQYWYTYSSAEFKPGASCKLTLYYLVPPDVATVDMSFVYDYKAKGILLDEPCGLFG